MEANIERIAIHYEVLPEIFRDLQRDLHNEMAGFLLGRVFSIDGKLWLYIGDSCLATDYTSTHTGVRINPRSFLDLDKKLLSYRRNYICVGWYHSHPFNSDFVHPSSVDKQTMLQSFSSFYHVSLIIDPISYCKDIWKVKNKDIINVRNIVSLVVPHGNMNGRK